MSSQTLFGVSTLETLQVHCILTIQSIQSICSRILFIRTHLSRLRNSRRVRVSEKTTFSTSSRVRKSTVIHSLLTLDVYFVFMYILYTVQSSSHKDDGVFLIKRRFRRLEFEI